MISRIGYSPKVQTLKNNINSKNNSVTNPSTSLEATKTFEFPKFANVYFMGENNLSKSKSDEINLADYPKFYINPETNNFVVENVLKNASTEKKKIIQITERAQDTGELKKITYSHPDSKNKKLEYIYVWDSRYMQVLEEAIRYAEDGKTPIYKEQFKRYEKGQPFIQHSLTNELYLTCESLDGVTKDLDGIIEPLDKLDYRQRRTIREFPKTGEKIVSLFEKSNNERETYYYNADGKMVRTTTTFPGTTEIQKDEIFYPNGKTKELRHKFYSSSSSLSSLDSYEKSYFDENGKITKYEQKDVIEEYFEVSTFENGDKEHPLSVIRYTYEDQKTKISEKYRDKNKFEYYETEYREDGITPLSRTVSNEKGAFTIEYDEDGKTPISKTHYSKDAIIIAKTEFDKDGNIINEYSSVTTIDKSQYPKEYLNSKTGEKVTEWIITNEKGQPRIHTTYQKDGKLTKEAFSYPETTIKQVERVYDNNGNLTKETLFNEEGTRIEQYIIEKNGSRCTKYGDDGTKERTDWRYGNNNGYMLFNNDGSVKYIYSINPVMERFSINVPKFG
jgi:hypothetical protein